MEHNMPRRKKLLNNDDWIWASPDPCCADTIQLSDSDLPPVNSGHPLAGWKALRHAGGQGTLGFLYQSDSATGDRPGRAQERPVQVVSIGLLRGQHLR